MPTLTWMWIGVRPILDPSANSNITQGQANAAVGWEASGADEVAAVAVTGNATLQVEGVIAYGTRYQNGYTSQFAFTRPGTGNAISGTTIRTFLLAQYEVRIPDYSGGYTTVTHTGVLVQMSTGDVFFRPAQNYVNDWDGIDTIMGVEIVSVSVLSDNTFVNAQIQFNPSIWELPIICFGRGTLIETENGPVAVENLGPGDMVLTRDHGLRPLRWTGARKLSARVLEQVPNLRPVRIRAGALGPNVPSSDLIVSPQHRILLRSRIALRMFGMAEVLVAARQLLSCEGIDVAQDMDGVEYFHFLFDQHEVVYSNGAETESLFTGKGSLMALSQDAQQEIFALFPELMLESHVAEPAYPVLNGRQGRKLAQRHAQNMRELVAH